MLNRALLFLFFSLCLIGSLSFASDAQDHKIVKATENVSYIFCFDGGGSKTALQVLNDKAEPLVLYKNKTKCNTIQSGCSNVIVVGEQEVSRIFNELLEGLFIGEEKVSAKKILKQSAFVGGFAGLGREDALQSFQKIVENLGFSKEHIALYSDAGLALELTGDGGAILIGGTGSICFIRENNEIKRVGGLGYRFGDAGSGYWIGLEAIKAVLEEEYGYAEPTTLMSLVKEYFGVSECKQLIAKVNGNQIAPDKIASLAPFVFQKAWEGDQVAYSIVRQAAHELGDLLASGVSRVSLEHCMTYLIGGLFQHAEANAFIDLLFQSPKMQLLPLEKRPLLINISDKMFPVLVTQEKIRLARNHQGNFVSSLPLVEYPFSGRDSTTCNPEFLAKSGLDHQAFKLNRLFYENLFLGLKQIHEESLERFDELKPLFGPSFKKATDQLHDVLKKRGRLFLVSDPSCAHLAKFLVHQWETSSLLQDDCLYQKKVFALCDLDHKTSCIHKDQKKKILEEKLAEYKPCASDAFIFLTRVSNELMEVLEIEEKEKLGALCLGPLSDKKELSLKSSFMLPQTDKFNLTSFFNHERFENQTEFLWGSLLGDVLLKLKKNNFAQEGKEHLKNLEKAYASIQKELESIHALVKLQLNGFSDRDGFYWSSLNETKLNYIGFFNSETGLNNPLEINTFFLNHYFPLSLPDTANSFKEASFNALLVGRELGLDNLQDESEKKDGKLADLIVQISNKKKSAKPFFPKEKKLFIAFANSYCSEKNLSDLIKEMYALKKKGVYSALIFNEIDSFPAHKHLVSHFSNFDFFFSLKNLPNDPLKIIDNLALKQTLNLLSKGTINGVNRIYGNMMIDLLPVDHEILQRTVKVVQSMYQDFYAAPCPYDESFIALLVKRTYKYSSLAEQQLGIYVPPVSKLVFTMLEHKCPIEEAVANLQFNNENIRLMISKI